MHSDRAPLHQPASPYVALGNRLTAFDPAGLDAAFAGYTLVKATLMRLTLHVVHADDHPAMQPTLRGPRLGDPRFTSSGLSAADADSLLPDLLEFAARPPAAAEAQAWLGAVRWSSWKGPMTQSCSTFPARRAPLGTSRPRRD